MAIHIDLVPVENEQEGLALMMHHLQLAAAYFEAAPLGLQSRYLGEHHSMPAIKVWIQAMDELYPDD